MFDEGFISSQLTVPFQGVSYHFHMKTCGLDQLDEFVLSYEVVDKSNPLKTKIDDFITSWAYSDTDVPSGVQDAWFEPH